MAVFFNINNSQRRRRLVCRLIILCATTRSLEAFQPAAGWTLNQHHLHGIEERRVSATHPSLSPTSSPITPRLNSMKLSSSSSSTKDSSSSTSAILHDDFDAAFQGAVNALSKTCNVRVQACPSTTHRFGLVATKAVSKNDVLLAMPYEDQYILTPDLALQTVFADALPESYDGWTGDYGLLALLVLNEVARNSADNNKGAGGTDLPKRPPPIASFMSAWTRALPQPQEMQNHPLLWSEEDQEVLQSSTTNKIYRQLDDIEEDVTWLVENVFEKDRARFPEYVTVPDANDATKTIQMPCFNLQGMKWAMAIAKSRSFFLDGSLRLIPLFDMCNHDDDAQEVQAGTMGAFGTTKGAKLLADRSYAAGEEIFCSYGPKSAADYLLEHGFVPDSSWTTAVAELSFELDAENDRFYDDKLDILEFETYAEEPMDPAQSFDIVAAPGREGEPDPAMIQFVRLGKLGGTDAFLLESIFRKEVWGFMELPVSEPNELAVVNTIAEACQRALDDFAECPASTTTKDSVPAEICNRLRESETKALTRMMEFLKREKEALDLKEYYQERRLKDLGLDSEWSPEDDMDSDLGFGQTRLPGGADYDW